MTLVALNLFSLFALANMKQEDCPDRQVNESSMGPIRDQGNSEICYAFAAADLVSFDIGTRVSPVAIAINYYRGLLNHPSEEQRREGLRIQNAPPSGGFEDEALRASLRYGFCTEDSFHSDLRGRILGSRDPLNSTFNDLNRALNDAINGKTPPPESCNTVTTSLAALFGNQNLEDNLRVIGMSSGVQRWERLLQQNCINVENPRLKDLESRMQTEKFNSGSQSPGPSLSEILRSGRPANLSYNISSLLRPSTSQSRNRASPNSHPASSSRGVHPDHVSVIVGMRWNPSRNVCEFKVRNSYGESCTPELTSRYQCRGGYFYLSETDLRRQNTVVTHIRP